MSSTTKESFIKFSVSKTALNTMALNSYVVLVLIGYLITSCYACLSQYTMAVITTVMPLGYA